MQDLKPHELAALEFLTQGPDAPGTVVDDSVMAAIIVFEGLVKKRLVQRRQSSNGPVYSLTDEGIEVVLKERESE